ncbi:regulatory protein TetR [Sphingobium chlorophenolicum L-1]|uniref:Regulatory protein TetR n=1 Tax=Sphingobium chlorophenolicum L-1 TaxID=690566 RepID=F6F1I6_SPHCR|nr:TetR/AcrR family transcriptional regulator [Sphingobium chlorophenolicum]AEG51402.1 regulatory protein TetR [Sphingobium chlorophenolicum L-1]
MASLNKMDARQIKSRNALFDALDAMLGERRYSDLTILDLVERAGVGRQTFYRHFESIDAMLQEKLRLDLEEQRAIAEATMADGELWSWIERLATFAFERAGQQPQLYRLILSGEAGDKALRLFRMQIAHMMAAVSRRWPASALDGHDATFVQSFHAGGISALLLSWLESDDPPPPAEMGRMFVRLIHPEEFHAG